MKILKIPVGELGANCFIVVSGGECVVIDPGGEPEKIVAAVEKNGAILKAIILTHYHFDHILGVGELKKSLGGEILMHEAEKNFTGVKSDRFIGEGDEIKVGKEILKVIHTPGHSKGSICLFGDDVFFSGDTLFENGFGRTDYPGGSKSDMEKSLDRISNILKPDMKIYPGHGEVFMY